MTMGTAFPLEMGIPWEWENRGNGNGKRPGWEWE